jgi:hypothetical protein
MLKHRAPLLAAALAVGALFAGSAHAGTPAVYVDPVGDSGTAPDIRVVGLSDNGEGTMTGAIGLGADFTGHQIVYLALDTDQSNTTGLNGAEFVISMGLDSSSLSRWDGSSLVPFKAVPAKLSNAILEFTFSLADVGNPTSFSFWAGSIDGGDSDVAPDHGEFVYPLSVTPPPPPPPPPAIRSLLVGAAALLPKAGTTYAVPAPKIRLTDNELVTADSVSCKLTYAGKALNPVRACTWKLSRALRKKHLSLKLVATYNGATGTNTLPVSPR